MISASRQGGDKQVYECSSANWTLTYIACGETLGPSSPRNNSKTYSHFEFKMPSRQKLRTRSQRLHMLVDRMYPLANWKDFCASVAKVRFPPIFAVDRVRCKHDHLQDKNGGKSYARLLTA